MERTLQISLNPQLFWVAETCFLLATAKRGVKGASISSRSFSTFVPDVFLAIFSVCSGATIMLLQGLHVAKKFKCGSRRHRHIDRPKLISSWSRAHLSTVCCCHCRTDEAHGSWDPGAQLICSRRWGLLEEQYLVYVYRLLSSVLGNIS